jgi:hypothetical protein
LQDKQLTPTGFEPVSTTINQDNDLGNSLPDGDAKSGAVPRRTDSHNPELDRVIAAWQDLPDSVKQEILRLVATTG